jgi:hypothetical protein
MPSDTTADSDAAGWTCSLRHLSRFVVDCDTLLRIAAGEIEVAPEHTLLAPTLVRSQALASLYEAARRGESRGFRHSLFLRRKP